MISIILANSATGNVDRFGLLVGEEALIARSVRLLRQARSRHVFVAGPSALARLQPAPIIVLPPMLSMAASLRGTSDHWDNDATVIALGDVLMSRALATSIVQRGLDLAHVKDRPAAVFFGRTGMPHPINGRRESEAFAMAFNGEAAWRFQESVSLESWPDRPGIGLFGLFNAGRETYRAWEAASGMRAFEQVTDYSDDIDLLPGFEARWPALVEAALREV